MILAFGIFLILAYQLHPYFRKGFFYEMLSLALIFGARGLYILSKGKASLVAFIIFLLTIQNFFDEFFFDPTSNDWNEVIASILIVLITTLKKDKWIR